MRDFLPADVRRRRFVIRTIAAVYERYGFEPLETPAVENLETLLGKYGEEGNQLVFRILKRGAELQRALDKPAERRGGRRPSQFADLALRYDLTVPLARVVARAPDSCRSSSSATRFSRCGAPIGRRGALPRVLPVRRRRPRLDVAGRRSGAVRRGGGCAAAARLPNFTIRLNHRQLLTALLEVAGVPADKHADALVALDKLGQDRRRTRSSPRWRRAASSARRRSRDRAVPDRLPRRRRRRADECRCLRRAADEDRRPRGGAGGARQSRRRSSRCRRRRRRGPLQLDPSPGARPVVLHGRDHGDRRARPRRQPGRRRALRQPGRHVPRASRSRPAASRSGSSGSWWSWASAACSRPTSRRRPPTSWSRSGARRRRPTRWRWPASCGAGADGRPAASYSIRRPTSSASSSSTPRARRPLRRVWSATTRAHGRHRHV